MRIINNIRALYYEIYLEISSTLRYKFSVFSDVLVFSLLLAFFLASHTGTSFGEKYNYDNDKALLLLGYLAWTLAVTALSSSINSVSTELTRGTFYRKIHSRCSLAVLMFGEFVASILIELVVVIVLLVMAVCIWKIKISISLIGIISIVISTVGMYGLGLIVGGLTILYKRVGSITLLLQLGLLFVTDTIPTNDRILLITRFIPLTSCNEVIKSSLTGTLQMNNFMLLIVTSVIWILLGKFFFDFCIRRAKLKGNLLFF